MRAAVPVRVPAVDGGGKTALSEPDPRRVPDAEGCSPPDGGGMGTVPSPTLEHRLTLRCLAAGTILAAALCAINTYLTLRFGIIEEGAMISAIFLKSSRVSGFF